VRALLTQAGVYRPQTPAALSCVHAERGLLDMLKSGIGHDGQLMHVSAALEPVSVYGGGRFTSACLLDPTWRVRDGVTYYISGHIINVISFMTARTFGGRVFPHKNLCAPQQPDVMCATPTFCIMDTCIMEMWANPSDSLQYKKDQLGRMLQNACEGVGATTPPWMLGDLVLFPCERGIHHWWLAVAEMKNRRIRIVDSIAHGPAARQRAVQTGKQVADWIAAAEEIVGRNVGAEPFSIFADADVPQQWNNVDCGVFTIANVIAIVAGYDSCNEIDPTQVREWLLQELYLDGVRTDQCGAHAACPTLRAARDKPSLFGSRQFNDH
jgi:hypothetical protein